MRIHPQAVILMRLAVIQDQQHSSVTDRLHRVGSELLQRIFKRGSASKRCGKRRYGITAVSAKQSYELFEAWLFQLR
ncbi:Uncharacterised protein [Mycobacterium tuberculosis]|nr:Uncharacterised protein [Mycobacterium tuberculosis]